MGGRTLTEPSLKAMQKEVDDYIQQFKTGYFSPLAQMARLTEEMGELAREVNHFYGEKKKKASEAENTVENELADVFIIVLMMANSLNIDMTTAFQQSMAKFQKRDAFRFERKDGKVEGEHNEN